MCNNLNMSKTNNEPIHPSLPPLVSSQLHSEYVSPVLELPHQPIFMTSSERYQFLVRTMDEAMRIANEAELDGTESYDSC